MSDMEILKLKKRIKELEEVEMINREEIVNEFIREEGVDYIQKRLIAKGVEGLLTAFIGYLVQKNVCKFINHGSK